MKTNDKIPPMSKEALEYALKHNVEEKPVKKQYNRWKSTTHRFPGSQSSRKPERVSKPIKEIEKWIDTL